MNRVIDLHGHWGKFGGFTFFRSDMKGALAEMDRNNVECMVMSSHRALSFRDGNVLGTLPAIRESNGKLLGYWVIHPDYHDEHRKDIQEFEKHRESFIGFKFHGSSHGSPIDGEKYRYALEYADSNKLPVLMHTWDEQTYNGYSQVKRVAEKYKNMIFLMGHSGFTDYRRFSELARANENAYLELCAVYALDMSIETMVEVAGSEKIVFGTDLPWFDPAYGIGCVLYSRISDTDKTNILYNNAKSILARCVV